MNINSHNIFVRYFGIAICVFMSLGIIGLTLSPAIAADTIDYQYAPIEVRLQFLEETGQRWDESTLEDKKNYLTK